MAEHKAFDVVGPKFFYDENSKRFIIIWASTLPGNYYQAYQEDVQDNPRLWYTTTTDFKTFTPAEPFCEPGYSIKDGIILTHDSCYVLLHKDNRKMMNTLRVTFADTPVGPWGPSSDPIVPVDCESPFVQRNGNEWIVYYSFVDKDEYGAVVTQDFEKWTDISDLISLPKSFRFSSVLKIDRTIIDKIANI
jgi:hypothetical protein